MEQNGQTDLEKIRELVEMMIDKDLVEVEIVNGESRIHIKRPQPQQHATVTAVPVVTPAFTVAPAAIEPARSPEDVIEKENEGLIDITSPIVGTFYTASSPDTKPYAKVGSEVIPETVVCIIEAMKVMNEIKAEVAGTIEKMVVTNGQAVEYGQVLFKVRPD